MTANTLVLGFVIVLALALTAVLLIRQQRQAQQRQPHEPPLSRTAAPALNPRLHDETVASAAGGGSADDRRSGAAGHISVVAGAPRQTHTLYTGRPAMIGRHSSHEITLKNHRVSRDHARLVLVGGAVQLTDLGSTNGTFVTEGKRRLAPHVPEPLAPGAVFWIGPDVKLSVDAVQELASPGEQRESGA